MWVIRGKNAWLGVSAIRLQSRVSRDSERERQVEVGLLDTDKVYKMKGDKVEKFSASGLETSGLRLKSPERVRGGIGSTNYRRTTKT